MLRSITVRNAVSNAVSNGTPTQPNPTRPYPTYTKTSCGDSSVNRHLGDADSRTLDVWETSHA
jgi:hypothetical protein